MMFDDCWVTLGSETIPSRDFNESRKLDRQNFIVELSTKKNPVEDLCPPKPVLGESWEDLGHSPAEAAIISK